MDPEIYVFPRISSAILKLAASSAIFIAVLLIAQLLRPLVPGPQFWKLITQTVKVGPSSIGLATLQDEHFKGIEDVKFKEKNSRNKGVRQNNAPSQNSRGLPFPGSPLIFVYNQA